LGLYPLMCPSDGLRIFSARWPVVLPRTESGRKQGRGDRRGDTNASSRTDAATSSTANRSSPSSIKLRQRPKISRAHGIMARRPVGLGRGRQRGCCSGSRSPAQAFPTTNATAAKRRGSREAPFLPSPGSTSSSSAPSGTTAAARTRDLRRRV
jgi:hypothetical protein